MEQVLLLAGGFLIGYGLTRAWENRPKLDAYYVALVGLCLIAVGLAVALGFFIVPFVRWCCV